MAKKAKQSSDLLPPKPDVVLTDGRKIVFDFNKMSVGEWRAFVDNITVEAEDDLVERCTGLASGELAKLGMLDYRLITRAFYGFLTGSENNTKN